MSKVAHYLQEHLMGEVMVSADARRYFSTDGSVLTITPSAVIYPRNDADVRKIARFTWQLAERGRLIPITARGSGTDQTGAALGAGVIMVFPAHMNRIIELDSKSGLVTVEPGINYGKLQQTLMTHGRFLPSYPASLEYSTVGGAVSNNVSGERSLKYGDTGNFIKSLRVVLANGEIIETGRLSKREFNKKLGLATFEGEIYRGIDTLLEENHKLLKHLELKTTKNVAGYNLLDVKNKDGFDLTPLFVGSQGTLGIITEITLETEPHNPETTLMVGMFDDLQKAQKAIIELREMHDMPCSIEMVDENLLKQVDEINPNQLKEIITKPFPKQVLLVEFDDLSEHIQRRAAKKGSKILEKCGISYHIATSEKEKTQLWKLRQATSLAIAHTDGSFKAVPAIEDGIVPLENYAEFVTGVNELLKRNGVNSAVWGHAGDANLTLQPYLDLSKVGDRQKLFRIMDEYYDLVIKLGGSISGSTSDGRLRAPYLKKLYGEEVYELFKKVKKVFDPYGTLNPEVKVDTTIDNIKALLRSEYTLGEWYAHMPRS